MALVKCKECNEDVSDKATACPHCGAPVDTEQSSKFEQVATVQQSVPVKKKMSIWKVILWVFVALMVISLFANKDETTPPSTTTVATNSAPAVIPATSSAATNSDRPTSIRNNNTPACITEDLLDQFAKALRDRDGPNMRYLVNNGCFLLKHGTAITILRRGIIVSNIRVYVTENDAIELYAYRDTLEK